MKVLELKDLSIEELKRRLSDEQENLANLRFQYARNPPSTNATETVGKTYRITAFGVTSSNYDIRYDPGTMTVVAAP